MTIRVAFDIGGVISKYPDILRPIISALHTGGIEVYVITDMHNPKDTREMLDLNHLSFIPTERVLNSDFDRYGEACKAILLKQYKIDFFLDDFPAYVAEGCPLRCLVLPDLARSYYHDDWINPEGAQYGDFGRRKRLETFNQDYVDSLEELGKLHGTKSLIEIAKSYGINPLGMTSMAISSAILQKMREKKSHLKGE